tara:strand:+ start:8628 stop:9029 length:402 start_codon:yes stop_codon:yes gene_type:complete
MAVATFTYAVAGTADRDRVRFMLGDTDETTAIFDDDEIARALTDEGDDVEGAAARCAEAQAARQARSFDFRADGAGFNRSQAFAHWKDLAIDLRARAQGTGVSTVTPVDGYSDDIDADDVASARRFGVSGDLD